MKAALAPKTKGSVVLNAVLETEPLDLIAFFSSAISFSAAPGQSNYTAGSTFKDSFAHLLRTRKQRFVRVINWGYWGDTGIVASQTYRDRLAKSGVESISVSEGIEAFEKIMAGRADQVVAVKMHPQYLKELGADLDRRSVALPPTSKAIVEVAYQGSLGVQHRVAEIGTDLGEAALAQLEIISQHLLLEGLQNMGVLRTPGEAYPIRELEAGIGVIPQYNRLYRAFLDILQKADFIEIESERVRVNDRVRTAADPALINQLKAKLAQSYPETEAYLLLLQRCVDAYPEVLTGSLPHIDVLFPGGSTTLVDKMYAGNRRVDYFNQLLSQGIAAAIEHRIASGETVTILEVGAGTGGTTTILLKSIVQFGSQLSYTITDISPKLVELGADRFGRDYPFTQYRVLNIEKDVVSQGFELGACDIVLATNVLHATRDIRSTLSNLKGLLKTNGLLAVNELTRVWDFATLTFGLTSGWWLFEDKDRRQPNSPLLSVGQWQQVLEDVGFRGVQIASSPGIAIDDMDQCVIWAESDGWIEEKLERNDGDRSGMDLSDRLEDFQLSQSSAQSSSSTSFSEISGPSVNSPTQQSVGIGYVTDIVAAVLKMNPSDLEFDIPFERYGVDSLVAMEIVNRLEDDFGSLRKDLLFNHPTVERLSRYLSDTARSPSVDLTDDRAAPLDPADTASPQLASFQAHSERAVNSPVQPSVSIDYVTDIVAAVLKMNPSDLESDIPFERYGVDSLVAMEIVNRLEDDFGSLRKDLLFNHPTVERLSRYLSDTARSPSVDLTDDRAAPLDPAAPASPQLASFQARSEHFEQPQSESNLEAIAIIGLSGRFPGAPNLQTFWENLKSGRSAITEIPADRWDHARYYDPTGQTPGTSYSKWGAFLEDIDRFEPLFFNIAPRDAERIDPQERLFLETAWTTLEDAGYTRATLNRYAEADRGPGVGVFVGVMYGTYQVLAAEQWGRENRVGAQSAYWSIANRTSHVLDFHGPSLAVDTACSSSLTAIHLACESIRRRECRAAIAGGVNLILHPSHQVALSTMQMLSRSPHCRAFEEEADGFVTGEGVGAVLLKPLNDAIRDRDRIYGVIKTSFINNDGKGQGYIVPNPDAQVKLIASALNRAGIDPKTIGYVEAQAVGSPLADRIELSALNQLFGDRDRFQLAIGSLKPNIGHLEAASGIAQLTKVLLQLKYRLLVPSILTETPNPDTSSPQSSVRIQRELTPWKRLPLGDGETIREIPRRAGISSFGAGGANAHLVVEEYIEPQTAQSNRDAPSPHPILLSARKAPQLKIYARRLLADLVELGASCEVPVQLADVAYTLQVGREALTHRLAIVSTSIDALIESLKAYLNGNQQSTIFEGVALRENRDRLLNISQGYAHLSVGELESIAQKWSQGWSVDWSSLDAKGLPKRLSLPTYPFQGERYWIGLANAERGSDPSIISTMSLSTNTTNQPLNNGRTIDSGRISNPVTDREPMIASPPAVDDRWLGRTVRDTLLVMMAQTLSVKREEVDLEENLGDYGFDSISLTEFARQIADRFDIDIRPTLFFERSTIRSIAEYLLAAHYNSIAAAFNLTSTSSDPTSSQPAQEIPMESKIPPPVGSVPIADTSSSTSLQVEGIAVIGMSGIFPGSPDLDSFWENLVNQKSLIQEIPEDRFDWRAIYGDALREEGKTNSKWGGFIDGIDRFDAAFFNISPREAQLMDPQQRLFLQTTWKAIEDAGYAPSSLSGSRTGVFVGVASNEYAHLIRQSGVEIDGQAATGNTHSVLANRVSFFLNLRGPSEPIDTACSSSLVALHRAVNAIKTGECEMAIAGGVNLLLTPTGFLAFGKSGMLADDGCCKTFDDRADGYVRGEGVGVAILKPLKKALEDGDRIYGIVRGSAINHGGRANSLTAPNAAAQTEVISEALDKAGISAETITYIEAHGTGTALGDPVEINGLKMAFAQSSSGQSSGSRSQYYCGLGTVKTNIGHLETAAGIAGLVKVLLSLKNKVRPGLVHFKQLNRNIQIQDGPFYIVTDTQPWERLRDRANREIPRRAGISSFGFGGVNVHIVVEEFDPPLNATLTQEPPDSDKDEIVVLSARSEDRLRQSVEQYLKQTLNQDLAGNAESLADLAYTLQVGRDAMEARLAVVCRSKQDLLDALQSYGQEQLNSATCFTGNAIEHRDIANLLNEDPDHQSYLARAIERGQLHKIAALWVKGFDVDWPGLHRHQRCHRVPLPTYPFAKNRYWVAKREPASLHTTPQSQTTSVPALNVPPTVDRSSAERATVGGAGNESGWQPGRSAPFTASKAPVVAPTPDPVSIINRSCKSPAATNSTVAIARPKGSSTPSTSLPAPYQNVESEKVTAQPTASPERSNLPTLEAVQAEIRQIFTEFLNLDPAAMNGTRDFISYGVDSIAGLRIMQRVQDRFGEDIPMLAIFEHPNLERFSRHIFDNYLTSYQAPGNSTSSDSTPSHPTTAVPTRVMASEANSLATLSESVSDPKLTVHPSTCL